MNTNFYNKALYILFLTFFFCALTIRSAEYNFYFNNSEQGDNSTNNPNFNLNGQAVNQDQNSANDIKDQNPEESGNSNDPSIDSPNNQTPRKPDGDSSVHLIGGLTRIRSSLASSSYNSYKKSNTSANAVSVLLGSRLSNQFGLSAFGALGIGDNWKNRYAWRAGLEAEWLPGNLSKMGREENISFALLGGVYLKTIYDTYSMSDLLKFKTLGHTLEAVPYLGARLSYKFNKSALIAADLRFADSEQIFGIGVGVVL